PLLSGLWSDNMGEWQLTMLIKAPLFLLPLAFAGPVQLSKQQWEWVAFVFILLITGASVWCMFHYIQNAGEVNEAYLRAKTLVTPLANDHVRFSWLVSVAVLLGSCFCVSKYKENRKQFWILLVITVWLIILLHILAARTGLISFYIILAGFLGWLIIKKAKTKYSIALLLLIVSLPVVAYQLLPSLKNRVKYFLYEFEYLKKTHYLPGANDAVRIISLKAGWNIMHQQPATGVGFGDVKAETKKWYDANYPQMIEADKIYPSGEWAMYGAGCGWPGLFVFAITMFIPFLVKTKHPIVWWLLNSTAVFSLLFDPGLEVQFGVFIYAFVVLAFNKYLSEEKM
ncbi:MAG: O-antigen ligase family protein, partial [Bacteroidota bacterium]